MRRWVLVGTFLVAGISAKAQDGLYDPQGRFEITFSAGGSIVRSSANSVNVVGDAPYLFDDRSNGLGTIRLEAGYGLSYKWVIGSGILRASNSRSVVSRETAPNYPVQDEFWFSRSVDQTLYIPYAQLKYLLDNRGRLRYFFVTGVSLGLTWTTFKYETDGLIFGDSYGERKMFDSFPGIFGALGFEHAISTKLCIGGDFGYRIHDKVDLHGGTRDVYIPPYFSGILIDPFRLSADYSGPYAMVTLTVRP